MKNILLLAVILSASIFPSITLATDVTYISQTQVVTPYWHKTYTAAQAAAKDLDINLTIIEGQGHRIYQAEVIAKLATSAQKPDLLIFHAYRQNTHDTFDLLEQKKIPFVTYSNFSDSPSVTIKQQFGKPQEKYKYWLAERYVENAQGAALLVKSLIDQAQNANSKNTILKNSPPKNKKNLKVLALSGDFILESLERSAGVATQVNKMKNVTLVQDINAHWDAEDAKNKFKTLFVRHKGIDVVWASSDVMALGVLTGALELGLTPNKDIFIGGFDWKTEAITELKQKRLNASAGGQFYNIAWLLVQVYDHLHNKTPFTANSIIINDKYTIIEPKNLKKLEPVTHLDILTTVNFYCFTKSHTRQFEYDFSMKNLLKHSNNVNKKNCLSYKG